MCRWDDKRGKAWDDSVPVASFVPIWNVWYKQPDWMYAMCSRSVQQHGECAAVQLVPSGNIQRKNWRQQQRGMRAVLERDIRGAGRRNVGGDLPCMSSRHGEPIDWSDVKRGVSSMSPWNVRRKRWGVIVVAVRGLCSWIVRSVPRSVVLRRLSRGDIQRCCGGKIVACLPGMSFRYVEQHHRRELLWGMHPLLTRNVRRSSRFDVVLSLRSGALLRLCWCGRLPAMPIRNIQSKQGRKQLVFLYQLPERNIRAQHCSKGHQ